VEAGELQSEANQGKSSLRHYLKNKQKEKDGVIAHTVESMPSKCEALSSIPGITKNKICFAQKPQEM
jgi:hypothetical protein